jgi:hypothetical protein
MPLGLMSSCKCRDVTQAFLSDNVVKTYKSRGHLLRVLKRVWSRLSSLELHYRVKCEDSVWVGAFELGTRLVVTKEKDDQQSDK